MVAQAPSVFSKKSQIIAHHRKSSQIIANHHKASQIIGILLWINNFGIITDHRTSSQIIADHRKLSQIVADHRQSSAEGGGTRGILAFFLCVCD